MNKIKSYRNPPQSSPLPPKCWKEKKREKQNDSARLLLVWNAAFPVVFLLRICPQLSRPIIHWMDSTVVSAGNNNSGEARALISPRRNHKAQRVQNCQIIILPSTLNGSCWSESCKWMTQIGMFYKDGEVIKALQYGTDKLGDALEAKAPYSLNLLALEQASYKIL